VTERRRFALIAPNYFPLTCGVGDHTMRLAAELQRRGNEAVVFTHEPARPNPEDPAVRVRGVPGTSAVAIAAGVIGEIDAGRFTHAVIQYTPQMWNAGRFGSPALPMLAAALRRRGVHTTLIMHELVTPWAHRPDLFLGALFSRAQLALILSSCSLLFVTTESRRRFLEPVAKLLSTAREPAVMRIGPGATPVPANAPTGGRRIGVFSTLSAGKPLDVVIDAFEDLCKEPAVAAAPELLIIGDLGAPTNRAVKALRDRVSASPAARHIRVTGKLPLREIAQAVASLNVYLFPMTTGANTRSSTLPVPLAAGVPVVAIRGHETDAIFEHGRNVYFASGLNGPAFAQAAIDLFRNPDLASRIAEGGRRLHDQHLAWNRTGEALMEAISRTEAMYPAGVELQDRHTPG
jgi:glycosyltransferase involved in cell wall biosynthesis